MNCIQAGKIRIGVSGWRYAPWRGVFYPARLTQKKELHYCGQVFPTVEINGSFYSLQRPTSYQLWRAETPEDFVFAVKGSRFITHMLKLRNVEIALANFFASGLLALGPKAGADPVAASAEFQFPSGCAGELFQLLPRTMQQAADLATGHDVRLAGRAFFEPEMDGPLRHAIEIRHQSFVSEEFIALLRRHRIALMCANTVEWPLLMDVTADFVYCRLHGSEGCMRAGTTRRLSTGGQSGWSPGRRAARGMASMRAPSQLRKPKGAMCMCISIMTRRCGLPLMRRG